MGFGVRIGDGALLPPGLVSEKRALAALTRAVDELHAAPPRLLYQITRDGLPLNPDEAASVQEASNEGRLAEALWEWGLEIEAVPARPR